MCFSPLPARFAVVLKWKIAVPVRGILYMSRLRKGADKGIAAAVHTDVIDFAHNPAAGALTGDFSHSSQVGTTPHALVAGPPAYLSIDKVVYVPQAPGPSQALAAPAEVAPPSVVGSAAARTRSAVERFMSRSDQHGSSRRGTRSLAAISARRSMDYDPPPRGLRARMPTALGADLAYDLPVRAPRSRMPTTLGADLVYDTPARTSRTRVPAALGSAAIDARLKELKLDARIAELRAKVDSDRRSSSVPSGSLTARAGPPRGVSAMLGEELARRQSRRR